MFKILTLLNKNPALRTMVKGRGTIVTNNTSDEAYLIAGAFLASPKKMVIVKESQYQALQLYKKLKDLIDDVVYYPSDESLRIEAVAYSYELLGERILALDAVSRSKPVICITHTHAMIRYTCEPRLFNEAVLHLKVGEVFEPTMLRMQLLRMGYHISTLVESPFYMAKRGGVLDVYSIQYEHPVRIEFFDDEIDTISFFDVNSQRRVQSVSDVTLLPATDLFYDDDRLDEVIEQINHLYHDMVFENSEIKDEMRSQVTMDIESLRAHDYSPRIYQYLSLFSEHTFLDFAPDALVVCGNREAIEGSYRRFVEENATYTHEIQAIGHMLKGLHVLKSPDAFIKKARLHFVPFKEKSTQVLFNTAEVTLQTINEASLIGQLKDLLIFNKLLICLESKNHIDLMTDMLQRNEMSYTLLGAENRIFEGINIYRGTLKQGLEFIDEHVVLLTSKDLFKSPEQRHRYIHYDDAAVLHDYSELSIGDYVVHDANGIGQYMGIKTLEVMGVHRDYLYIAYKGNDILYVPVENFRMIRKYAPREGKVPQLHALGSTKWAKEKARVRSKVDGLADQLIDLYAKRMASIGFAFLPDDSYQEEFEKDFGYVLTPGQARSIEEIKADMEIPRPMDRLLCGDVGFGKTEVALRACFKAILSGKQCAFLCPTTILSSQHYRTMIDRFKNFPVTIALLNRFTTTKEKNQILADLKAGKVDILVGTHRILSKDVLFKDLGLLCIDEEQRFGVRQKEKIKELKKTIDVLTLTATPIPRTLQMSLMGIRGLSRIDTPPLNRLPVQTYVNEKSLPLIKQVIERELARDGQVFYLYNRTETIVSMAHAIQTLVPEARIAVGHGQMDKGQLDRVMQDFIDKKYDILICTTIIETGIDIPNANTIIIEDADRFGLAQLYQIKGRVGRSERIAYAYLLYAKDKILNEEAAKRLKAIKEFTQLGSGYKIAMRDLSIRGAGDILGGEQAGFIDTVGFDMYMKILQEAIDEKRGQKEEEEDIPATNIKLDGYIPESYVDSDIEKLELYTRIYKANKLSTLDQVTEEMKDMYGQLPHEINNIIMKRRFDILSHDPIFESVKDAPEGIIMTFTADYAAHVDGISFFDLAHRFIKDPKPNLSFAHSHITVTVYNSDHYIQNAVSFMEAVIKEAHNG